MNQIITRQRTLLHNNFINEYYKIAIDYRSHKEK